ncbi:recombinase family protein [Neobacillus niacini]|uniref:recombinase family protein n=1 Tax=Neobacillus niacini TaxID=86668 RepID=UPI0021CAFE79|nr:recombinase family protein [Neobacillus niacini]MCM3763487.1 recombinase family protein [Neobacillus niacini]
MRAALYIRVSTQEQVENYSIESQRERLEAYCKSKDWIVYDTFIDPGYSGSNTDRPALQRLLSDLKNIDVVVVYKLDRLSRSQRDTLDLIEEHFLKNNVEFVSITETLDTSTPFGKAMIGILSVFAQLERETIAERMRMGLIKRAEEGYWSAGGNYDPAGYGLRDGELYIKGDEAAHIRAAFDLYEQYHSITKVQTGLKELGFPVWRFRRYNDILRNRLYIGEVSFAGTWYKGRHKSIISKEQFTRVQVLLSRHKGNNAHKAKQSLLSGLITCGDCGENYITYQARDKVKKDKYYRYYLCRARRFPSEYDEKCMNKTWNYSKLEALVIDEINSLIIDKKTDNKKTSKIDYDKLMKKVDEKMERTLALYVEGKVPVALLNKQVNTLEQEKIQLQIRKDNQNKQLNNFTEQELNQYSIDLLSADFPTRQAIVQKLIKQIEIHDENVEIAWNF